MRHAFRALAALLLGLIATPALAVDTSFYTYDGFAETVDAFRLVSMIFADPRYETLVMIIAVVGIALGAVIASVRGQGMGLVAFGFQIFVGVGLFVGLVATTGTVHVYDKVRNAYQPVGDVPNLLVLVAGVTNLMERSLAETIDDNTLDPNAKLEFGAGGHSFDLFLNAVSPRSRTMSASVILWRGSRPPMASMTINCSAPPPTCLHPLPPWRVRRPSVRSIPPRTRAARR